MQTIIANTFHWYVTVLNRKKGLNEKLSKEMGINVGRINLLVPELFF